MDDLPPSAASPEAPSVDPTGAEAARAVIREYYDAISAHDGRRAYLLWADSGRATNQTLEAFVTGYARTTSVRASVGTPGRVEGAAGSRYVEIPVEIRAEADTLQCFTGSYALRRSVVEGATEAQRHWRIYDADLEPCRSDQRQGRARGP